MRLQTILFALLLQHSAATAQPPLAAYGALPTVSSMAISPDGKTFSYLLRKDGGEYLAVYQPDKGVIGGANVEAIKAHGVSYANAGHVILSASETKSLQGYRGRFEYTGAFSYNFSTSKIVQLLRGTEGIYPAQSGLGDILGVLSGSNDVFMAAYTVREDPSFDLYKIDLDSGRGKLFVRGNPDTIDWTVDRNGVVLARVDYDDKTDAFAVKTRRNGAWEDVYKTSAPIPPFAVAGVKQDRSALLIVTEDEAQDQAHSAVFELGFDGAISPPKFARNDAEVESILADANGAVLGVAYTGMTPTYEFYDAELTAAITSVNALFPDGAVWLGGWSDDFSKLVFHVSGGRATPGYFVLDRATMKVAPLAKVYAGVGDSDVGEVMAIEYKARDGLRIPAILTWPSGEGERTNLPLIVMPHGGPETYDSVGFDWLAQYFASRGYLVLQPNFRGSAGFGAAFREAGYGEWGGKMQDDVTDGVNALVAKGWADSERICIVGGSYGGYSALAGGAFTPDLYKCVAAVAPVSDLPRMLYDERNDSGADSWVLAYWERFIGQRKADRDKLERISPINHAAAFKAPVLLLHGNDDTVVPYRQSERMAEALKSAGKKVTLIKLKGGDHWLSTSETRLRTLTELDKFVSETIGTPR